MEFIRLLFRSPRASVVKAKVPCSGVKVTARLCCQCLHNCWRYLLPWVVGTLAIALVITAARSFAPPRRSARRCRAVSPLRGRAHRAGPSAPLSDCPSRGGPRRCRCVRSEEHTSELQSLMRISYAVFCFEKIQSQSTTCLQDRPSSDY